MSRTNRIEGWNELFNGGFNGEKLIRKIFTNLFQNQNIVVLDPLTEYETYDIFLKNLNNGKVIKIECETATTALSKNWAKLNTIQMLTERNPVSYRPYWPDGLDIPARKIYQHNDAEIIRPFVLKDQKDNPFKFYYRTSLNGRHFFAVEWNDMVSMLNEDYAYFDDVLNENVVSKKAFVKGKANSIDKLSNTNNFVIIPTDIVKQEINNRLIVDDFYNFKIRVVNALS